MTKVIGINGFKQSGKGTTANIFGDLNRWAVVRQVGFADKLKVLAARTLGFRGDDAYLIALMDEFKLTGRVEAFTSLSEAKKAKFTEATSKITGRQYLQNLGNDAREVFGENFWVDQVLPSPAEFTGPDWSFEVQDTLAEKYNDADFVVFTDLRYPNEAARIQALGGVIWNVQRPGLTSDGHASEQPLPPKFIDWTIYNTDDVDHLANEVERAVEGTL